MAANPLALEEQVCFALAVASREVVAAYKAVLEPLGLTHPQYLVMLALWQHGELSGKDLSAMLYLDPGTLSPLVKRLEAAGLVSKRRSAEDERIVLIAPTPQGAALRTQALDIPATMLCRLDMSEADLASTNRVLHRIIESAHESISS
jgi:DNA-binding MarR family transcriptional regulator